MPLAMKGYLPYLLAMLVCASLLDAEGARSDAAELVRNAGFEDGDGAAADGWYLKDGGHFRRVEREGRSGTSALLYENAAGDETYTIPTASVAFKPDTVYRFGVWVKTEDLESRGDGALVCMEWYAGEKYLGGAYAEGVTGTTEDWRKVVCTTPRIPSEATRVIVAPLVRKGSRGKAWFDDVFVEPDNPQPVKALLSNAYRDAAATGDVTFCAALDLDASELDRHRAVFAYKNARGKTCEKEVEFTRTAARLTIPVKELAKGEQTISFKLTGRSGGRRWNADPTAREQIPQTGRAGVPPPAECNGVTLPFTRLASTPSRKVWIDAAGRAIVDGKPFFPLGMFWNEFTSADDLALYAKSPFNCIMPYWCYRNENLGAMLDDCAKKGIRVIPNLKDYWDYGDLATAPARTEAFVKKWKDHPSILAWYVVDETPLSKLEQLKERRALVTRLDPDHPTWGCFYQHDLILDYVPSCDVIGTDPYPIGQGDIASVSASTRDAADGTRGCRALWQVPQAFDWGAYRKDDPKARPPTFAELRNMCWQCVANGANGLVLYSFFDLKAEPHGVAFESRWADCCRVAEEIRRHEKILLAPKSRLAQKGAFGPSVSARFYSLGGKDYALFVNSSTNATTVTLPPVGSRVPRDRDGAKTLALEPLGVELIKISK